MPADVNVRNYENEYNLKFWNPNEINLKISKKTKADKSIPAMIRLLREGSFKK